jgi:hypothetical protein
MIKKVAAMVVLVMIASLLVAGCTSNTQQTQTTNETSTTYAQIQNGRVVSVGPKSTTTPTAGGSAGGGLSFSAHQVPISANDLAGSFYSAAAARGYTYVGFYCTLTNNGASTYETSIVSLKLVTTTGVYTDDPYVYQKGEFPTGDISLRNGEVVNGVALFQVPAGTTGFNSITYSDGSNNLRADL